MGPYITPDPRAHETYVKCQVLCRVKNCTACALNVKVKEHANVGVLQASHKFPDPNGETFLPAKLFML